MQLVELIHHLAFHLVAHRRVQFAAHVGQHFLPERFQSTLLHAEGFEERIIEFRQRGFLHFSDGDGESRRSAAQCFVAVVFRKGGGELALISGRKAPHARIEVLDHLAATHLEAHVLATAAFERLAIQRADEIQRHPIRLLHSPVHGRPGFPLFPELVDHLLQVFSGDFRLRLPDPDPAEIRQFHCRKHFKGGGELEVDARIHLHHFQAR